MTRLALLADIHGNEVALKAVLDDIAAYTRVDQIVVAGDVVNWGPHNVAVIEHITRAGWAVLRGNQEWYILDQDTPRAPEMWNRYTVARWTRQQLGSHWLNVIATWPDALALRFRDAPTLRVVHGSPNSHFEGIFPRMSDTEIAAILTNVEEETVIAAHTHLPLDRQVERWHVLNPGSVGMPLDGRMEATYLILDGDWSGWRGTLRRVPFDPEPILREFARLHFANICGATGRLVIEEFKTSRLHVLPFLVWSREHPDEPEDVLLARYLAGEVDPWAYTPPDYHINL
ncbi:MAG: metallophosphoesterase family protein [Anaerolineae bacterium]|nr:metallophosphoesterase family protein [Anaerolineae bacterium]